MTNQALAQSAEHQQDEAARRLPYTLKVGGSNPSRLTIFPRFSREAIGLPECPYMRRWVLDFGLFAIRIHHWTASDDARHFHDHPWPFLTFVLRGSYTDASPAGADTLRAGSIRFRPANHRHTVQIHRPTWTLVITGHPSRRWGFWVNGKLLKRDKYFAVHGHHPCDPATGTPVRMRPDSSRVEAS